MLKGKGQERAFTGEYWWYKDVGTYHCRLCDKPLFPSHYKFQTTTGHATFFASLKDATKEKCSDLSCSNCHSHLGTVKEEGPAPTYRTLTVNSASVLFKDKPFFKLPPTRNALKEKRRKEQKKAEMKMKAEEQKKESTLKNKEKVTKEESFKEDKR
jgi:peptide methionine sulfoxide reductase MsrB